MFVDQSAVYAPSNAQGVPAGNSSVQNVPTFQLGGKSIALTHKTMVIGAVVILAVLWLAHRYGRRH